MSLKITISGVRGIVGKSLTEDFIRSFIRAYIRYSGCKKIALGTDTRLSREFVSDIVLDELCAKEVSVVWLGIAPTPTVQVITKELGLDGGIVITASHNPSQWNGLKFVTKDGVFLNEKEATALIKEYEKSKKNNADKTASADLTASFVEKKESARSLHLEKIIKNIDAPLIRSKKITVALDPGNGAGSKITKELLSLLGCRVIAINDDTEKEFQRGPEPVPQNLGALEKLVLLTKADIGFAQDPDADRLSIVSNAGAAIGEEYSLALCAAHLLEKNKEKKGLCVAANLSTSRMLDDIAKKYGAEVIRTKVGEVNVSEKMKEKGCLIGGEGNGGVIFPKVGFGRDSLSGIALVLEYMAKTGKTLSGLAKEIPSYVMIKDKIEMKEDKIADFISLVKKQYPGEKVDETDGSKIEFKKGWVHIRPSNTEPVVRFIAEGKDRIYVEKLIQGIRQLALS